MRGAWGPFLWYTSHSSPLKKPPVRRTGLQETPLGAAVGPLCERAWRLAPFFNGLIGGGNTGGGNERHSRVLLPRNCPRNRSRRRKNRRKTR